MTEPTRQEVHTIELIAALDTRLEKDRKHITDRLKSVPDLYRQWRIAETAVDKVITGLYKTLPIKTLSRMRTLYINSEIVVRPKNGVYRDVDTTVVLVKDLNHLAELAKCTECDICIRTGRDVRKCKLRETLIRVDPKDHFEENPITCEYAGGK